MSSLRLKEQDALIDLIRKEQVGRGTAGAFAHVSALLSAAAAGDDASLLRLCPRVGKVFLPLDLPAALAEFDEGSRLIARTRVPPSFSECRQILNLAVLRAAAGRLELLTLDADDTLYSDGGVLSFDAPIIPHIVRLLRRGVAVCVVTAAAYPGEPAKYEGRFAGLLAALAFAIEAGAPAEPLLSRFLVMGGQCNYLLRAVCGAQGGGGGRAARVSLEQVEDEEWKAHRGVRWDRGAVAAMLDAAEGALRRTLSALRLHGAAQLIRKERAVGVVPRAGARFSYEVLEELALATQAALLAHGGDVPACAFNGGRDVFVDVGTKALGIRALQGLLGAAPRSSVHVGDRFTPTGNDVSSRDVASTLWVASPKETVALLERLLEELHAAGGGGSGGGAAEGAGARGEGEGGAGGAKSSCESPTFRAAAPLGGALVPRLALLPPPSPAGGLSSAHGSSASLSLARSPRAERGPGVASGASFHEREEQARAAAEAQASELRAAGGVVLAAPSEEG
jgi:IMP and pyridine-specific 5'-nucleotidase